MRILISTLFVFCSFLIKAQVQNCFQQDVKEARDYQDQFNDLFENKLNHSPGNFTLKPSPLLQYKTDYLPGLFCKIEHQLELKSKLAPRFRLGSLEYTEWMEGKRKY